MTPRMSDAERTLLASFLRCSDNYFEFGAGGSTCVACGLVARSVTALDSSRQWIDDVAAYCAAAQLAITPELIHVDVGPTGAWGYPADTVHWASWPAYHGSWGPRACAADLYLVDGRFRVACFMQTVLHCRPDSLIMIHDFASRPEYHIVREVAREVAVAEDLSVFRPVGDRARGRAVEILETHAYVVV